MKMSMTTTGWITSTGCSIRPLLHLYCSRPQLSSGNNQTLSPIRGQKPPNHTSSSFQKNLQPETLHILYLPTETSIQTPAQAWLQVASATSALELHAPRHLSVPSDPHNVDPQGPAPVSCAGMSVSNRVSSEMSLRNRVTQIKKESSNPIPHSLTRIMTL